MGASPKSTLGKLLLGLLVSSPGPCPARCICGEDDNEGQRHIQAEAKISNSRQRCWSLRRASVLLPCCSLQAVLRLEDGSHHNNNSRLRCRLCERYKDTPKETINKNNHQKNIAVIRFQMEDTNSQETVTTKTTTTTTDTRRVQEEEAKTRGKGGPAERLLDAQTSKTSSTTQQKQVDRVVVRDLQVPRTVPKLSSNESPWTLGTLNGPVP